MEISKTRAKSTFRRRLRAERSRGFCFRYDGLVTIAIMFITWDDLGLPQFSGHSEVKTIICVGKVSTLSKHARRHITEDLGIAHQTLRRWISQAEIDAGRRGGLTTEVPELALQHREARRVERLIKQARFPAPRTFEDYEFEPIAFPSGVDKDELMSLDFLDRRENILCIGAVGTGKTHLAVALGMKACTL